MFHYSFSIERDLDDDCSYDFLEIYGPDGSRLHGPLCGIRPPEPIQFNGEVMVYFKSDSTIRKLGFSAAYGPTGTVENENGEQSYNNM